MREVDEFDEILNKAISTLPFKIDLENYSGFEENPHISLSTKIRVLEDYFSKEFD